MDSDALMMSMRPFWKDWDDSSANASEPKETRSTKILDNQLINNTRTQIISLSMSQIQFPNFTSRYF